MKYCMQWRRTRESGSSTGFQPVSARPGWPCHLMTGYPGILVACIAVMLGCFVCSARGADVGPAVLLRKHEAAGQPNIYVPYQDLAGLIDPADKAVLMDRAEFEKLLAAAEANAQEAGILELGQVKHAEYLGKISGEELTLTGELEVVSMGDGPVAVPLGFARMGLTRVIMDGKPAPLGYDKQGRLTLIVTAKGSHQIEIAGTTKLKELTSGGMQFGISLPPAVAGRMKLSAPGDLEMHATVPMSQPVYDKETDRTNVELTIGGQDRLTVVLLGNGRREDDRAILLGESAATVSLTRSHQVMGCLYTVQVLRRGVRELQFQLPSQWTVTEVTCPSLVRWSVDTVENETGQGSKILSVHLRSARIGTTALHIKATAPRTREIWRGPRVILVGAAFQRGYLMVSTDEGLAVRGEKLTDVRREDVSAAARLGSAKPRQDSVPGMVGAAAVLGTPYGGRLYFHWGDNWSVDLELAAVPLRRSIKERQGLVVSPEQVTLTGDFEVTAIDRELFDISFVLGGLGEQWQIRTVQVDGKEAGFEYRIEEQAGQRLLRIELPRPVRPEKLVNVRIVLQSVPSDWHWPSEAPERSITVPLIESRADTVSGHVSISAVGDLDVRPLAPAGDGIKLPDGLEVVPVGRMASLGMPGEVQYAYGYKAAVKGEIQLRVSRRRPRIAGDAVGLVTVQPREFTGDWRITYMISRASAKRLYLLVDKSLARKIKITSPAVPISSKSIVAVRHTAEAVRRNKTLSLPAELAQRYNLWLLNLDHKAIGAVAIDVHYERPRTSDKFVVPLVRPICDGQITEQLAVQASEELALTINAAGAKEIDAVDLPPLPVAASRILSAFRLQPAATPTGAEAAVTLETTVHQGYRVPSALAVSAELTTYLDVQGGQRTEATFRVANAGRQFLTFRLPEDAQLWSLSVAGRQTKPQRSPAPIESEPCLSRPGAAPGLPPRDNWCGDYQVPLGQFRKPVPVKIVYLWQSYAYQPGKARLKRLQVGGVELPGVEINQMSWNIVPPPGYQITAQETKMQTDDLVRPTPAYVQLYNFLAENLFSGSLLMPSLSRVRRVALSAKFQLAGEDIERAYAKGVGAKAEAPPPPTPEAKPSKAKEVTQKDLGVRLVEEGRFTLPVDLVPTPGAGRRARFTGLGTAKLIVGLTSQSRQTSWWAVGFVLIVAMGVVLAWQKVRVKAILFVAVLSFASLMAIWWPTTTHFANGAFTAGICLVPLYVLIWLIRLLAKKLCLGGVAVGPEPVTVVTLLVLLLCLGCSAQTAYAAQPGRANPGLVRTSASSFESQRDDKAAPTVLLRKNEAVGVIIPYEGDPTTAEKSEKILIPYTRFVRLWNQAHPDDPIDRPRQGTDVSLASVRYRVTVEKEYLKVLLTADIRTYGKDWVVLAMPIEGLAVTEATIDGKAAPVASFCEAKLRGQTGPKGMVLMLPGEISGQLQLSAVVKPKFLGRRGSASFSLPPLPGAVMDVVLPEEDLELEVDGIEGALRKESQGLTQRTVQWTFPLGMARKLTLRWLPKMGEGAADRTLSATSIHDVYAFHWATVAVTKITYGFSGGRHDRFTLLMPEGATLTDLKGTNIRDYREVGEKVIEGRTFKIIEVRLALPQVHRAAKKQYELTVRWLAPLLGGAGLGELPTLEKPARLFLVRAGDVSRESGTVTLHSAGGMIVKVAQVIGGRRTSVPVDKELRDTELTADRTGAVAKYYWPYRPFSLYLKLSRLTVSPKVNLDQLVRISADQVQLLVQASLKAERGRLFGASFVLPAGYELLSVVGPDVENFYERQDVKSVSPLGDALRRTPKEGNFLHVKFQSAVRETKMALVLVRPLLLPSQEGAGVQLEDFQVPTIMFIDSGVHPLPGQEGRVAVQVAASLEAGTLAGENLKPIAPRTLHDWLDANQLKAVQFAYRYEAATPSLRLNIRRQPTRVRVEIFAGLSVKATAAAYTYRLRYNITGSPLDRISFRLPNEYAPLVAVESPAMRSVTQSDAPAPSCEGKSGGRTSWTVSLVNEVTGIVDVTVNFALPIDPSTKALQIPRIETEAPEGYRAIVAVQNMSRHEIDVNNLTITNLAELPVSEQQKLMPSEMNSGILPPQYDGLQYVFQSFEDNWSLGLDFTPAKMAARIQAVVDLLALTTVIDRNGRCRYEARVALQNRSEQFLRVKVPKGLRLWSANVAGQPVKPVIRHDVFDGADSPAGEVLIPLVKTSPGGLPYDVYLYFAGSAVKPLNGITRLKPPAISIVGMPVMQTTWSLRLPDGYRYLRPGGNMSPIAGTVEMLSLSIEARLDQLKRLEKSYRDVAGSFSQRERIARRNWEVFNDKLAGEITQTERYLEANSGEVSREDYRRLKSKLGGQKVKQSVIITGNAAFVRGQQEQARQDMNFFLNASASNPGMAEGIRNAPLLGKPEFVSENERRQMARLKKELELSEQQQKESVKLLRQDRPEQFAGLKLSRESAAQIEQKQEQIRGQLSELADNRMQRHFQLDMDKAQAFVGMPSKKTAEPLIGGGFRAGGYAGRYENGARLPGGGPGAAGTAVTAPERVAAPGPDTSGISVTAREEIRPYVARGIYSLPVTLPEGEVRLDFARPAGEAQISLWAVPVSAIHGLYSTLAVIAALFIALGVIKIWPTSFCFAKTKQRRPISVKRIIVYVLLLVVLTLIVGLLGLLISLFIVLLCEARRGAFTGLQTQ